jgi:hypothetical protein
MAPKELEAKQLHDGLFLTILWDTPRRIIGICWKSSTASMTEDFKAALTLFAGHVESWLMLRISSPHGTGRTGMANQKHLQPLRSRGRPTVRVSFPAGFRDSAHDEPVG